MQRITAATAALFLAAAPAIAQDVVGADEEAISAETDWTQLIRTRDITGGPVYTTNETYDEGTWGGEGEYTWGWSGYEEVGADWNQIGEIEDIVLDSSGQLIGVVAEVGGFLDIGDKHVMLRVGDVDLVPVDDHSYSLITRYSEEQLEEMEGVHEGWWE